MLNVTIVEVIRLLKVVFVCFPSGLLVACTLLSDTESLKLPNNKEATETKSVYRSENLSKNSYLPTHRYELEQPPNRRATFYPGTGQLYGSFDEKTQVNASSSPKGVTLNLRNVSISQASKAVLGDILKLNYTIDDQVTGKVTIQTSAPVDHETLLNVFETILSAKGAAIVEANSTYKIVLAGKVRSGILPIRTGSQKLNRPGVKVQIVPLLYIGASEMARVLQSIVPREAILSVEKTRNTLVFLGTDAELAMIDDAVKLFDIDIMKGKSFAFLPISNGDTETIAGELEKIFETKAGGSLEGAVKFVPNRRLGSILVISTKEHYLKEAQKWVARLDKSSGNSERRLHVYTTQNRPASELTKILQNIFDQAVISSGGKTSTVAPRFHEQSTNAPAKGRALLSNLTAAGDTSQKDTMRFVVDEGSNAILIMATGLEYKRVTDVLRRIDVMPNQVLLEAVIAEVSLNDELKFGLRWFFQQKNHSFTLSDAASGAVSSVLPGFSYFFSTPDIGIALNALASITNVKVISSPSLMVLNNKTATLQVGDQVPVVTQSSRSTTSADSPIVNSVEFKNTGVILSVTPRVSDSGRVVLEIEQEVSNVVKTTTSGIDSPTIQQRKIKTTVAINDGESLTLGGLIQERNNLNRGQVPLAGDLPIIGNLFKNKTNSINRTELLIMIRPQVIRNMQESKMVTEEFRERLNLDMRASRSGPPTTRENISRVFGR